MTSLSVAQQTLDWLLSTGRIGSEAETIIAQMGKAEFLQMASDKWDAIGSPRFMQGMKDVMQSIIWEGK
jgi:hypothetical protein